MPCQSNRQGGGQTPLLEDPVMSAASSGQDSRPQDAADEDEDSSGTDRDEDDHEHEQLIDGEPIDDASDLIRFDDDDDDVFEELASDCRGLAGCLEPLASLAAPIKRPADIRDRLTAMDRFRESVAARPGVPPEKDSIPIPSPPFCRICRDTVAGRTQTLVSPCLCKGSVALVHTGCLERWLAESDSTCCELCGSHYRTVRTPRYHLLASIPAWAANAGGLELLFDLFALTVFTPVALAGTYLGVNAEEPAYVQISLMAVIDLVYTAWLVMRFHYHFTRWHSWWRRKFTVKLILDRTPSKQSL